MKPFKMLILMLATGLFVSACNTMGGMGEDIQAGGKKLENAADRHK
ncbi:MAG: entericidin A/B family lipoprotein [Burkholderiaceae bacterium]